MDINARNFAQEWPAIEAAIAVRFLGTIAYPALPCYGTSHSSECGLQKCDFMAIDTEMTGLGRGTDRPIPFESPAARYMRIKVRETLSVACLMHHG